MKKLLGFVGIIVFLFQVTPAFATDAGYKICPFCAEQIKKDAIKCRYCGEWLDPEKAPPGVRTADPANKSRTSLHAQSDDRWTGDMNLFLGFKGLETDDWEPTHEHKEGGIKLDFKKKSWPVSLACNIVHSMGDGEETYRGYFFKMESSTTELNLGIKKIFNGDSDFRPFFGGGLVIVRAHFEFDAFYAVNGIYAGSSSVSDTGIGLWLDAGLVYTYKERINIGASLGYSTADVEFDDFKPDAGGWHAGGLVGYRF